MQAHQTSKGKSRQLNALAIVLVAVYIAGCIGQASHSEGQTADENSGKLVEVGKDIFAKHCNFCHNGALPEAPLMASLKLLPRESILTALRTGVMKNQASTLSPEEHLALAEYISEGRESPATTVVAGKCEEVATGPMNKAVAFAEDSGMGMENWRYTERTDLAIDASNVSDLTLDWVFAFPDASRARVQPTILGKTLFTASQHGTIYALDRATGCIRWTFQADAEVRSALTIGFDAAGLANRLFFSDFNAVVYSLDLRTKTLIWKKKVDAHEAATITGSLAAFEGKLYVPVSSTEVISAMNEEYPCCDFRGSVVALDALTGEQIWKTFTIDEEAKQHGHYRSGVARYGPSGAPVWTRPTIDSVRRSLYVGTGENYSHPTNNTSDAIMAMGLDEGEIKWIQQTIPKDAWNAACVIPDHPNCPEDTGPDADFGASPILVRTDDQDFVLVGQKSGMVYALDPDREGAIMWKTLVGRGGIMGGVHWGMASDGQSLYVPINDHGTYPLHQDKDPSPGLHALDIETGALLWSTIEKDRCPETDWSCGPGITAAITATPDLVFAGALDGMLKAYSASSGHELWSFDTQQTFSAVNLVEAFGGTIDSDGPVLAENQLFVTSGYAKFNEKAGNVLLAFSLD